MMKKIMKCLGMALVVCMVNFNMMPVEAANKVTIELDTYYYIASALDLNQVIDVSLGSHSNGANIQLHEKNGTDAQLFKIVRSSEDGYYYIVNKGSEKVLDIEGGGICAGTNVQLYEANDTQAQHWRFYLTDKNSHYLYIVAQCGKFLDVQGGNTKNGTNIWIYDGNKTTAQKFLFVPYINTSYENVNLEFNDVETWKEEIEKVQRRITFGGNMITNPSGNTYYNGKIITGMNVLSWKTIDVKVPLAGPGNAYKWEKVSLPCEIQYKLHTHNNDVGMWFDFTRLSFYQQCECGYRDEWEWEVPWPDLTENTDVQTTKKVIDYIKPQHTVLYTIE